MKRSLSRSNIPVKKDLVSISVYEASDVCGVYL